MKGHFFIALSLSLILVLVLGIIVIIVNAQGTSFDTAEEISTSKSCVKIDIYNGIQYWKTYVSLPEGQYIRFYVYPEPSLHDNIAAAAFNSTYGLIGKFSDDGSKYYFDIYGPYDGYVYIKVALYGESGGYYSISVDGSVPPDPSTCTTSSGSGGSSSGSSSNSGGACPAGCNPPFPCSCNILGWDPCAALASIYCAFQSFGQAVTSFFQGIVKAIQGFVSGIVGTFTSIPKGIVSGLKAFVDGVSSAIGSLFDAIGQSGIADWIRDNGFIVLGIILILVGIVIRPAAWIGALLVFFGLMQHGFRIEYLFIIAGLILLVIIAKR